MTFEMDMITVKGKDYDVQWHWGFDGLTIDEVWCEGEYVSPEDDMMVYMLIEESIEEQVEDEDIYCSDCDGHCTCDSDYERSRD